jgi:3-deoxy-D-manno-octulosonic-acid transferase
LLTPFLLAYLWWRGLRSPAYRQRISERFGHGPRGLTEPCIWLHAVSVGEVQAAEPLVRHLLKRYPDRPLVLTTMTPTGSARVLELFGEAVVHSYVPVDLPRAVRRFFGWARPQLAIIMETELWPNIYRECRREGVPLLLASARISARSLRWYRRLGHLIRDTLSGGVVVAAQSEADAERFIELGANPDNTRVTGNIKFDFTVPAGTAERGREFRAVQAPNRPVWIAASTHADEEQTLLVVHEKVRAAHPDALLILVPRHPERFGRVGELLEQNTVRYVTWSSGVCCTADTSVFLGDTMGELQHLYAAADVAFVAGSLVPIGGHNLLEPAALGLPVLTGPHNFNAPDILAVLSQSGAAQAVADSEELAERLVVLLGDEAERRRRGAAGRLVLEHNGGALQRVLALVETLAGTGSAAGTARG